MKNWSLSNLAGTVRNMRNTEVVALLRKCEERGFWRGYVIGAAAGVAFLSLLYRVWPPS